MTKPVIAPGGYWFLRNRNPASWLSWWAVLLAALLAGTPALALPRYAATYGQSCVLCHENPTGGGLRNLYATQYLIPEEIAARGWPGEDEDGFLALQLMGNYWDIETGADAGGDSYHEAELMLHFFY